jgi:hypothetical protein
LIDDPAIRTLTEPGFVKQWIVETNPMVEDVNPLESGEAVGEGLGTLWVVELGEGVVGLDEAEVLLVHLPSEPVVAIDVDLNGEREAGFLTDMNEAKVGIEKVMAQDAEGPTAKGEAWPTGVV